MHHQTSINPQEKLLNHNELNLNLKETDEPDPNPEGLYDICSINENRIMKWRYESNPLNIGSEYAISMNELAYITFETIGQFLDGHLKHRFEKIWEKERNKCENEILLLITSRGLESPDDCLNNLSNFRPSFSVLDNAILSVENGCAKIENPTPKLLIVVPTYRVQMQYLETVIKLKRSETASTSITFIVDNLISLASEARNRELFESNTDYVLFLDNDLTPEPDILIETKKVVRKYPKACGFEQLIFLDIAEQIEENAPWGVTDTSTSMRSTENGIVNQVMSAWAESIFGSAYKQEDMPFILKDYA
ncbi:22206_t:CDS:10, partial [Dentiscutata erythropus]